MKRGLIIVFAAALLVVAMAAPAAAGDFGAKTYTWGAHCNTRLVLYLHGWWNGANVVDGRMDVHTCTGSAGITAIIFTDIIMYRNRRSGGVDHIAQIGQSGYKNASITNANYSPVYTTSDAACGFSDLIQYSDDVWVNADYQVYWEDGSHTAKRDNNSAAVTVYTSGLCGT